MERIDFSADISCLCYSYDSTTLYVVLENGELNIVTLSSHEINTFQVSDYKVYNYLESK